jgi:hypothetical protein
MGGMGGMPGEMGGMGGLMGMVMGRGGGVSPGQTTQTTETSAAEIYDVTRWKQAETESPDAPTAVQAVRADWERKKQEKSRFSLENKWKELKERFAPKKAAAPAAQEQEPSRQAVGTIQMPELKKASQRIKPDTPSAEVPTITQPVFAKPEANYLGLITPAGIDGFFGENPTNSVLLAVDTLSMGGLALNQVAQPARVEETSKPIESQGQTAYMDSFHEAREARKYDVRIT